MNLGDSSRSTRRQSPDDRDHPDPTQVMSSLVEMKSSLPDEAAERWFFRIDGRDFGPATRAQLEYLLTPPRISRTLQVMCSEREGEWHNIGEQETLDKVLMKFGIPLEPAPLPIEEPTEKTSLISRICDGWTVAVSRLANYGWVIVVILGIMVFNGVILYVSRDPYLQDREILAKYESIWETARSFDPEGTSREEWKEFSQTALAEIEPYVKQLSRSASVNHPVRQSLLYLGREDMPNIFNAERPPAGDTRPAKIVERRLQLVKEQLVQGNSVHSSPTR